MIDPGLVVVIPTYHRPELLRALLQDLAGQTCLPVQVIVVDGDPAVGNIRANLIASAANYPWHQVYIPSNHGNAPYQRYLGVLAAGAARWLAFIDDDMRLREPALLEKLAAPFTWDDRQIVGISPRIVFPGREVALGQDNSYEKRRNRLLAIGRKIQPGGLTPSGDRIPPIENGDPYLAVEWLRGGVMAYRMEALQAEIFSADAFAMSQIGCGLGVDDTYLSRCVGCHGELLLAACAQAEHPDADRSQVYPAQTRRRGFAVAYSRRFLNDHYRLKAKPKLMDRLYLLKTYLGNLALNWGMLLFKPSAGRLEYASGYTHGVINGLFVRPTSRTLAPKINWLEDAKSALACAEIMNEPSTGI